LVPILLVLLLTELEILVVLLLFIMPRDEGGHAAVGIEVGALVGAEEGGGTPIGPLGAAVLRIPG
jgi:hypothetical protein